MLGCGAGLSCCDDLPRGLNDDLPRGQAMQKDPVTGEMDEEVAFHAARALSLLSTSSVNQRKIFAEGGCIPD